MTARIAYLTALTSGGGRAMLRPPRRLYAPASFPDLDLGFQPEHTVRPDASVQYVPPDHADPESPQPRRLQPGQSQPFEHGLGPPERATAKVEPARRPGVTGNPADPPGTAASPPGQSGRSVGAASEHRASGDPSALGPEAALQPRAGPRWRAPHPGGPPAHPSRAFPQPAWRPTHHRNPVPRPAPVAAPT